MFSRQTRDGERSLAACWGGLISARPLRAVLGAALALALSSVTLGGCLNPRPEEDPSNDAIERESCSDDQACPAAPVGNADSDSNAVDDPNAESSDPTFGSRDPNGSGTLPEDAGSDVDAGSASRADAVLSDAIDSDAGAPADAAPGDAGHGDAAPPEPAP